MKRKQYALGTSLGLAQSNEGKKKKETFKYITHATVRDPVSLWSVCVCVYVCMYEPDHFLSVFLKNI